MNELKIFERPEFGQVRVQMGESGEPWLCAVDVCKALGYTNPRKAIADHVEEGEVTKRYAWVVTGKTADGTEARRNTKMSFVNESGMYSLIFGSTLKTAKEFRRWVTHEVLPSIRKSGGYMVAKADETPEQLMARALKVAEDTLARQEKRVAELEADNTQKQERIEAQTAEIRKAAPKVAYYEECLQSVNTLTATQVAKELGMEAHTLNKALKQAKIIFSQSGQWMLHSPFCKWGLHATRTQTFTRSDGSIGTSSYTVWTQKGRRFIHALNDCNFNVSQAIKTIKEDAA